MWKKSISAKVVKHIKIQADSGYQGINKLHENSETPKRKTKKQPLTKEEKANNRRIGSERIGIEHVNCRMKRLHILQKVRAFGTNIRFKREYTIIKSVRNKLEASVI